MLNQPYLDLSHIRKPWAKGNLQDNHPWQYLFFTAMDHLFYLEHTFIPTFSFKGKLVTSKELFLDFVDEHLFEIENNLLHDIYRFRLPIDWNDYIRVAEVMEFNKLSRLEKIDFLNLSDYAKDYNLKDLWQQAEQEKRSYFLKKVIK